MPQQGSIKAGADRYWLVSTGTALVAGDAVSLSTGSAPAGYVAVDIGNLANAGANGGIIGIVSQSFSVNSEIFILDGGIVPPSLSGLSAGAQGTVSVNSSGRLVRSSSVPIVGLVDTLGNVRLAANSSPPSGTFGSYWLPQFVQTVDIQNPVSTTVTAATAATPINVTVTSAAGLANGSIVVMNLPGITGGTGQFVVAGLSGNSFNLQSSSGTGSYTSGGTCISGTLQCGPGLMRIYNNSLGTSPMFGQIGGDIVIPDPAHMAAILSSLGVVNGGLVTALGLDTPTSAACVSFNYGAFSSGVKIRFLGPGIAGLFQLTDSGGTAPDKFFLSSGHAQACFEDMYFEGVPNSSITDCANIFNLGNLTNCTFRRCGFKGVLASAALMTLNTSGPVDWDQCHFSGSGLTVISGNPQTRGLITINSTELSWRFKDCINYPLETPDSFPTPVSKAFGIAPFCFVNYNTSGSGEQGSAGGVFDGCSFGDTTSGVLVVQSTVGGDTFRGNILVRNCHFSGNSSFLAGATWFSIANLVGTFTIEDSTWGTIGGSNQLVNTTSTCSDVVLRNLSVDTTGFTMQLNAANKITLDRVTGCQIQVLGGVECEVEGCTPAAIGGVALQLTGVGTAKVRHSNLSAGSLKFGAGCGAVYLEENQQQGTVGFTVDVSTAKPTSLIETFEGVTSDYMQDSGITIPINSTVQLYTTAGQIIAGQLTVKAAQVRGVAAAQIAANGYGPVQRPMQTVTLISDGTTTINPGDPVAPSTGTIGDVAKDATGVNTVAYAQTGATNVAGTTFTAWFMAGGNPGITQLTGDVVAGPGSGSVAAIVEAISGTSPIPISPSNLQWASATATPQISQATAASGATPQSMTVSPQAPNAGSTTVAANTPGSYVVNLAVPGTNTAQGHHGYLQVQETASNPFAWIGFPSNVTTATASAAVAYLGVSITPGAANWAFGGDGLTNTFVNAPSSSGVIQFIASGFATNSENPTQGLGQFQAVVTGPQFKVFAGSSSGSTVVQLGQSTGGGTNGTVYLGFIVAGATNWALQGDGTANTFVNAPSGGTVALEIAGSDYFDVTATQINLFSATASGAVVVNFAANAGHAGGILITQATQGVSNPGANLTIQAQQGGPVLSGTNNNGGNLVLTGGNFGTGGTGNTGNAGNVVSNVQAAGVDAQRGYLEVQEGGTNYLYFGKWLNGQVYGAIWGGSGTTPSSLNYALISNGTATQINGTSNVFLLINGSTNGNATGLSMNLNGVQLFTETLQLGGGSGALSMGQATTAPTTNPTASLILWTDVSGASFPSAGRARSVNGVQTTWAAAGSGTVDAQARILDLVEGVLKLTGNSASGTLIQYPTVTGHSYTFFVFCTQRCTTSGTRTAGNTNGFFFSFSGHNAAGTFSVDGSATTPISGQGSASGGALTAGASSANALVTATNSAGEGAAGVEDYEAFVYVVVS